jgi:hemerythrin
MPLIQWTNELSVGIAEIDKQHQQLIGLLNALHEAMVAGAAKATIPQVVHGLAEYATTHFAAEERYMMQSGFPFLREHQVEHAAFTKKVRALQAELPATSVSLTVETMNFMRDWLVNHIQKTDKRYAPYLIKAGLR